MVEERFSLAGRVAIVTGGGRGIGRAIAEGLAQAGADVAVVGRTLEPLQSTVESIEALGRRGLAVTADLTAVGGIDALFTGIRDELGGLDILVNSAGVLSTGPALEVTEAEWDASAVTNLKALFFCCQAAGRQFVQQRHGKIVNIASTLSQVGMAGFAAYCASKGGVLQVTRTLAAEWAGLGVNVNAIGPAAVRTELNASFLDDPDFRASLMPFTPAGRIGETDDVVGSAIFLCSRAADYVHGALLLVDGGYTAL